MHLRNWLFIFLFHCVFPSAVSANNLQFSKITVSDGLSNNFVRVIHKDSYGFMWFGTSDGLDRFDGVEIRSFAARFPNEHKRVNCITDDPKQGLWVGTEKGLLFWDFYSPEFKHVIFPGGSHEVTALHTLPGDSLILTGSSRGIFLVNTNTHRIQEVRSWSTEENPTRITGAAYDGKKYVWMSSSRFLIRIDLEGYHIATYQNDNPASNYNNFSSICLADSLLIVGTHTRGIFRFDPKKERFLPIADIGSNYILALEYSEGKLFVGSDGWGFIILDLTDGSIQSITQELSKAGSLNSNAIYSIYIEKNKRYWIGTYSGGVNYRSSIEEYFYVPSNETGVPVNIYNNRAIFFDRQGNKLIGTDGNGLIVMKQSGAFSQFTSRNSPSLRSNVILSMKQFKDKILLGTFRGGVSIMDLAFSTISEFRPEGVFMTGSIYGFDYDMEGNLWIGGMEGLSRISASNGSYRRYTAESSALVNDLIIALLFDSRGRLWTGSVGGGTIVYELVRDSIFPVINQPDLSAYKAVSFYEDNAGQIWIATEGHGLIKVTDDLGEYQAYTTSDGLPSNMVTSITEAPDNIFWISTQKGLCYYDTKEGKFVRYTLSDGLPSLVFNRGAVLNEYDLNGHVWFGSEKGLIGFTPDSLLRKKSTHQVVITDIYIAGQAIKHKKGGFLPELPIMEKEITIKGGQKSIGFRFVALNYYSPSDNEYAYRLLGRHQYWEYTNGNHVTFSDLKPGKYTFEIFLGTGNLTDQPIITSIDLILQPYLYERPSFIISLVLVMFVIISLTIWFIRRLKQNVKQLQLRQSGTPTHGRYESSHLSIEKKKEIEDTLVRFVPENKPYLNPDLKLSDLAKMIDCAPHDISQVINQNLNQTFYSFINAYRIEAVKARMTDPSYAKYTLLAIAQQCGYSSKTSFYRAFRKLTGQSPQEYQAELKDRQSATDSVAKNN